MDRIEHSSVAGLSLDTNKKLGYYLVDNNISYHKFQAIIDASKTNSQVRWFFNEDVFFKYPWHIEPATPISELYRLRAQQLRDQYDYIRVECSGGADSTTVVYSFLLNGIRLDEVVFRYPKLGEKNVAGDPYDTRCENTLSEWEFASKPLLNWIATNYPEVKITVHDYAKDMVSDTNKNDESWIFKTKHFLQPGHVFKHDDKTLESRGVFDSAKSIAIVYGVDKPKVCIKDNKFFICFNDVFASHSNPIVGEYTNITNEYFYWTPDMPELLAKQAHLIKNWFSMPSTNKMQNLLHWPNVNFATRTLYEQTVKAIIYPDYDTSTFQTIKPTNNIWNEMDHWVHTNFKGTQSYNLWEAGISYLISNIDEKYVRYRDDCPIDITVYDSVYYYIGDSDIVNTSVLQTQKPLSEVRISSSIPHMHCIHGKLAIY